LVLGGVRAKSSFLAFRNREAIDWRTSLPIVPIDDLDKIILSTEAGGREGSRADHRSEKPFPILIQPPQSIHSIPRPADQLPRLHPSTGRVLQYTLQLVRRGRLFGYIEFEFTAAAFEWGSVVDSGRLVVDGSLLEAGEDAGGGGEGGCVEESDDIEGFVLKKGKSMDTYLLIIGGTD